MQFQVPQFIEVEDKIFGPLTFKQFVYLGGGIGTAYIFYRVLPSYIAFPLMLGTVGLAVALAFFQVNGRPFILGMESAFYYFVNTKLYLWNNARKTQNAAVMKSVAAQAAVPYVPKLSESRLHDLAWSLDINERIRAGTVSDNEREYAAAGDIVAKVRTARSALTR